MNPPQENPGKIREALNTIREIPRSLSVKLRKKMVSFDRKIRPVPAAEVVVMVRTVVKEVTEIPLHILPTIIARQIRNVGDRIYRISVKRTHWHHYNISVRTKLIRKELAPVLMAQLSGVSSPGPANRVAAAGAEGADAK